MGMIASDENTESEDDLVRRSNFLTYFLAKSIGTVFRLNATRERPDQDEWIRMLSGAGVRYLEFAFTDGRTPPKDVIKSFIAEVKQDLKTGKFAAVHCMAGLGRTGVLIGAYAVAHHGVQGTAWHGWARMCRPGSVQTECQEVFIRGLKPRSLLKKTSSFNRISAFLAGMVSPRARAHAPQKLGGGSFHL
jgi:hypothetical protein